MNIVDRHLVQQLCGGMLIAAAVLLPLFGFFDLVEQLDDVGEGFYRTADAFVYVALLQPRRLIQLLPFIALLGTVIALGRLAVTHELVALRAAGLAPLRLGRGVLLVGAGLLLLLTVLEQWLAPPLQQAALARRSAALQQTTELGTGLGIWTRDAGTILRIGSGERPAEVELLWLDGDGFLREYLHAAQAVIGTGDAWQLRGVTHKQLAGNSVRSSYRDTFEWRPFLDQAQMETLSRPPESLAPTELWRHVRYLQSGGQQADAYALALWRKPGGALVTLAMLLLAVPFALGSVRTGLGQRLLLAAATGIGVYLADQIFANAGLLFELDPRLVALAPGTVLLAIAFQLLRRAR